MLTKDIVFIIGVPFSKEDFKIKHTRSEGYASSYNSFAQYEHNFLSLAQEKAIPTIINSGVEIVLKCNLSMLSGLFQKYQVVIFFSHWEDDMIEFYDGLFPIQDFINQIPLSFTGIIDLTVCHSVNLYNQIGIQRPACLTKYSPDPNNERDPDFWFLFYQAMLPYLKEKECTYFDAYKATQQLFIN